MSARFAGGFVVQDVGVVELPSEGDLLLDVGKLLLQVPEVLCRLQLGVVLGDGEEVAQGAGQHVVGGGGVLDVARLLKRRPGLRYFLEGLTFVLGVALHGLDQVGHQAGAPA